MNRKLSVVFFIVGLLVSNNLKADTVFYCQSDLTTGFIKKNDTWQSSDFADERYTIKFRDEYRKLEGLEDRPFDCVWAYDNRRILNTVVCTSGYRNGLYFHYNFETKRFLYLLGTVAGYTADMGDTNTIEIGTCKDF